MFERPLSAILSSYDFEDAAHDAFSKKAWAFYSSAATDLISFNGNQSFYRRIWMRPRLLRNVAAVSTQATVLGASFSLPVVAAPVALARLANPCGEMGIAGAVAKKRVGYCVWASFLMLQARVTITNYKPTDSHHCVFFRGRDHRVCARRVSVFLPAVRQQEPPFIRGHTSPSLGSWHSYTLRDD